MYSRHVLAAIKREIPLHHFIVVDGYSTDGTIDVVREFFGDKVAVKTNASLGGARYIGMNFPGTLRHEIYYSSHHASISRGISF